MHVRTLAAGVLAAGAVLVVGGAAPALAQCDAYSQNCPTPPPSDKLPTPSGGASTSSDGPDQLPFSGGEITLMTAIGVGALGGGTALVVAGRRRKAPAA
jgi:hypothetical protein